MTERIDEIARAIVDTAFHIHKSLGPGLLESAYELILAEKLTRRGLAIERQIPIDMKYDGIQIPNAFKIDLLVEKAVVVELKAVESFASVHARQVLTYLKITGLPVGLLINFGLATFKEGVRRFANNHEDAPSWRLGESTRKPTID